MNRFQQDAGFHQYVELKTVIFSATHYIEIRLDYEQGNFGTLILQLSP